MNSVAPELTEMKSNGKERQSYRLSVVITALRDDARQMDARLETAITGLYLALEDGKVEEKEAYAVLRELLFAFKANSDQLNALNLLDESGSEPALREVERKRANRRNGAKK